MGAGEVLLWTAVITGAVVWLVGAIFYTVDWAVIHGRMKDQCGVGERWDERDLVDHRFELWGVPLWPVRWYRSWRRSSREFQRRLAAADRRRAERGRTR